MSGELAARAGGGEEGVEVGGGEGGHPFGSEVAEGGEEGGGVGDEGGLVLLAAVRDGGEEGGVGLDQDAVGGSLGGDLLDGGGLRVGEVAGEGEVEAGVDGAAGLVGGAGEAVHDAAEGVRGPVLVDEGEEVFEGVCGAELVLGGWDGELGGAAVDEDGFAEVGGDLHLCDEGRLLEGDGGVVEVVVVEADLADGEAEGVGGEAAEGGEVLGGGLVGLLGVDADAGVDAGCLGMGLVGDLEGAVHGGGAVTDADGEQGFDAGGVGAGEDGREVFVGVEVAVGVDQHVLGGGGTPLGWPW